MHQLKCLSILPNWCVIDRRAADLEQLTLARQAQFCVLLPDHLARFNGLVLCFPYQSARIDPVAISLFLMGIGGGWIVVGLVVMDRL